MYLLNVKPCLHVCLGLDLLRSSHLGAFAPPMDAEVKKASRTFQAAALMAAALMSGHFNICVRAFLEVTFCVVASHANVSRCTTRPVSKILR